MTQVRPYHAGRDTTGSGADHHVGDLVAPELLALVIGQEGQGRLLQLVGSLVGCGDKAGGIRALHPISLPWVRDQGLPGDAASHCVRLVLHHHDDRGYKAPHLPLGPTSIYGTQFLSDDAPGSGDIGSSTVVQTNPALPATVW